MTGTARKKVNSAAVVLESPIRIPPRMVAPDLEVPGKMAAISWKSPTSIASRYVIWAILVMRAFFV